MREIGQACDLLVDECHGAAVRAGWYTDLESGQPFKRNVGELLMLIVSELGEAMNAFRKDKMDDHLKHRPGIEVEIADALIRIYDLCGAMQIDIGSVVAEKMAYNAIRLDHKLENRRAAGGKKF